MPYARPRRVTRVRSTTICFEVGDKAFYCFELVIRSYNDIFGGMIFKSVEIIKGKRIYDYSTFLDDPERWEIIVNSEG